MGENKEPPQWDLSPLVEDEDPEKVKKSMDECLNQAEMFEKNTMVASKTFRPLKFMTYTKSWIQSK